MQSRVSIVVTSLILLLVFASLFSLKSVSAATYNVSISTNFNGVNNGNNVPIAEDGAPTSFSTPHTFSGLSGIHNFTVPYEDSSNHPFSEWDNRAPTDAAFPTITVSSAGSYAARYDTSVPRNSGGINAVSPAEQRYYVTPSDPAVVAAAANKSWSDILNWVASQITYNFSDPIWQFPNETLALRSGQCRDYSTLCVSMLLARGYTAYVVSGNVTIESGVNTELGSGHAWVVLELSGSLYHFEPQMTWAEQPSPQNFSLGYFPTYFNDNTALYPAEPTLDLPSAQTYDVNIYSSYSTASGDAHVPISQDGVLTGLTTPHTFAGLSGIHNFTVPCADAEGRLFMSWSEETPGEKIYPTITVSSGGSLTAFYDLQLSLNSLWPAEYRCLITPSDPAVETSAANKDPAGIVDFVSALPYMYLNSVQFPNQTLAHGTCYRLDLATVCVSMLRSAGYVAYLVGGNTSTSSNAHWVVFNYKGVFYHVDPYYSWKNQQTVNFGSYQASYYVDENSIGPAGTSQDPPATFSGSTPNPTPASQIPEFSTSYALAALAIALAVLVAFKRRALVKKTI